MKNKKLVLLSGIFGGVLFVFIYKTLLQLGLFVRSYNYTATGSLDQAFDMMLRDLLVFILGVYAGSVVPWVLAKIKPPKSSAFLKRFLIAIIGAVIFASPLFLTARRDGFPGENAPMQVRHEWALKEFKIFYSEAVEYLKKSDALTKQIGRITAVAPTMGRNSVGSGPGEVLGCFTLDIVGTKGKGMANVEFIIFSDRSEFSGRFKSDNIVLELEKRTERHP